MSIDRNLIFGVLALQNDYIDLNQFDAVCRAWASSRSVPVADLLTERGWIDECARGEIERLAERKLRRHGNDPALTLGAVADSASLVALRDVGGRELREALATLAGDRGPRAMSPPMAGPAEDGGGGCGGPLLETLAQPAGSCSRYGLNYVLGQGGLGRVWAARDHTLKRTVALKELRPDRARSAEAGYGFLREAQITGQLEHPNIVAVYDLARRPEDDQPFYTMKMVRGETMRDAIADHHRARREGKVDPLRLPRLLNAFVGVCNAIGYAHARQVTHRDLKPENIILGSFGEVIVLDWGLAEVGPPGEDGVRSTVEVAEDARDGKAAEGRVLGTPGYMAPEQAEGRDGRIGRHTDIYGLGAILFEVLTGSHPHRGPDLAAVLGRIVNGPTPRARALEPTVPPALDAVCATAMAREPAGRYRRAADLAEDVQKWLADEPVSVHRESAAHRAARWARRHRAWTQAAAAALVVVALVSSLAHQRVRTAYGNEQMAKREETRRFRDARDAADTLLTGVSEDLVKVPGAQNLRTTLLQKAADFYQRFSRERSEDFTLRLESGHVLNLLADVRRSLSEFEEADRANRQAESVFTALSAERPGEPGPRFGLCNALIGRALTLQIRGRGAEAQSTLRDAVDGLGRLTPDPAYRNRLAFAQTTLGNLLKDDGDDGEAEAFYRRALGTYDALVKAEPGSAPYRSDRARCRINLALILYERGLARKAAGKRGEAVAALGEAETAYRAAIDDLGGLDPLVPEYRERLGRCRINLGLVYEALDRPGDAEREDRAAIAEFDQLVYRTIPEYALGLVDARTNLANLLSDGGKEPEALRTILDAVADGRRLVQVNPDVADYRLSLGRVQNNYGILLLGYEKRPEDARKAFDVAVGIRDGFAARFPDRLDYRSDLRNSLSQRCGALRALGKDREAVDDAERLARLTPRTSPEGATDLFNAACYLSWAAGRVRPAESGEARRLGDRAVALLKEAASLDPTVSRRLDDADLLPVSRHPGFVELKAGRP